jgi:hypothetical protein
MMSKILSIAAATAVLIGTTALGHAQSSGQRMPHSTPDQKMQDRGSVQGQPGASGYAPGHQEPSTTGRGSMGGRDPDRGRGDER